jgi:hypothetical protein
LKTKVDIATMLRFELDGGGQIANDRDYSDAFVVIAYVVCILAQTSWFFKAVKLGAPYTRKNRLKFVEIYD